MFVNQSAPLSRAPSQLGKVTCTAVLGLSDEPSLHGIQIDRLYRAFVAPRSPHEPERTFYVEAYTRNGAHRHVVNILHVLERTAPLRDLEAAVYNVTSARDLISDGLSESLAQRLFETGWNAGRVVGWVTDPVFIVDDVAPLVDVWSQTRGAAS